MTGAGSGPAGRLQLEGQPVEVLLPVLGPLAVSRFLVVAGTAREVGRQGVLGARDGPVADAVAVDVLVPLEVAQPLEIRRGAGPCLAGSASPDRRTGSLSQRFMPRSRSVATKTGVWNCWARSRASMVIS